MSWHEVTPKNPCCNCHKPDWCGVSDDGILGVCRRFPPENGIHRIGKAGDYWVFRLNGPLPAIRQALALPSRPTTQCADPQTRNAVYRALLARLSLAATHRQDLHRRGLNDTEISARAYRTLPMRGRTALARKLVEQFGLDLCLQVHGFYLAKGDGQPYCSLAGATGLAIPVRDMDGHIVAVKVRADESQTRKRNKYTTVSSSRHHGPSPGSPLHIPLFQGQRGGHGATDRGRAQE